jgi:hypothetical protein
MTDKLYFLLKAYLGTQEEEERDIFLADLEGFFTTGSVIKKSYKRVTGSTAKFNVNFRKTMHTMDYFCFTSHLFKQLGYDGWVLLFDESELIGRMGKKTRAKSYQKIQNFLKPDSKLEGVFSLFAFSSSYTEDVIDKKKELANVEECFVDNPEAKAAALSTVNAIMNAPELAPLTRNEIMQILMSIQEFHGKAYDWMPNVSEKTLYKATEATGYLLRTKLRAAIEFFDQLYQYGEAGETRITELGEERLDDEVPELP